MARQLTELSREINRQIGILITRRGEVAYVIVGSHHNILIPGLDGFRSSSRRFKGLRLIHTHLSSEELTTDDHTALALLRLDLVCAVETGEDGLPGLRGEPATEADRALPDERLVELPRPDGKAGWKIGRK